MARDAKGQLSGMNGLELKALLQRPTGDLLDAIAQIQSEQKLAERVGKIAMLCFVGFFVVIVAIQYILSVRFPRQGDLIYTLGGFAGLAWLFVGLDVCGTRVNQHFGWPASDSGRQKDLIASIEYEIRHRT